MQIALYKACVNLSILGYCRIGSKVNAYIIDEHYSIRFSERGMHQAWLNQCSYFHLS